MCTAAARRPGRAAFVVAALGVAWNLSAQDLPTTPCSRIDEGQLTRVACTSTAPFEAPFAGCRGDTLLLLAREGLRAVPLADVTGLWVRGRATRTGFKTGGVIGAVIGGLFGVAVAGLANETGDGGGGGEAAIVGLGAVAGYLAFGGAGAVVGAAVADWREIPVSGNASPPDGAPAASNPAAGTQLPSGRLGSAGFTAGGAWAAGRAVTKAGVALGGSLTADFPSGFGFGAEFSWQHAGLQTKPADFPDLYRMRDDVWHVGFLARYQRQWGPVRPFVTVGAGHYQWDDGFLGWSLGAGVGIPLQLPHSMVQLAYRRHDNLQNLAGGDPGFHAVTVGLTRSW